MSIIIKIRENKTFSENEKICAKYILDNYKNIKNLTAQKISKDTFVSLATVTRMSQRLGFPGFQELKLLLIEEASLFLKENLKFDDFEISKNENVKDIIKKINGISIEALRETKLLQNEKSLEKVAELIAQKNVIDFYGVGASYIVCLDAEYKFLRAGKQTNTFNSFDKQYIQAKNSTDDHLAILVSYSGQTEEMIEIADILKAKNIETVSITRITSNVLAKKCKHNIFVTSKEDLKRAAAIYSRISMLNVIDMLYFIYFIKNYDLVSDNISKTTIKKR